VLCPPCVLHAACRLKERRDGRGTLNGVGQSSMFLRNSDRLVPKSWNHSIEEVLDIGAGKKVATIAQSVVTGDRILIRPCRTVVVSGF
jgi:hypothetical protein